jgi:hypothetical protein
VRRLQTLAPPPDVVGRPSSPSPLITRTWSLLSLRPNGRPGGASPSRRRATTLMPCYGMLCQRIRPLALWLPTCWLAPSAAPGPLHRTSLHDIRPVTPLVLSHFTALCLAPNCHCNLDRRASPQLPGLPQAHETGC